MRLHQETLVSWGARPAFKFPFSLRDPRLIVQKLPVELLKADGYVKIISVMFQKKQDLDWPHQRVVGATPALLHPQN